MYDPFNPFIFDIVLPCVEDICYHHGKNGSCVPLTPPPPHLCRLEMVTWFVCGSWLGNAWLNMPPPSAPGQTAADFAGLFQEELHVT